MGDPLRQLKHSDLRDIKLRSPPYAIGPTPQTFITYDEFSTPSVDYYLIDADYQIRNLPLKRSSLGQSGELCPNLSNCPIERPKISVDNKARFGYLNAYWFRLMDASIYWAAAKAGTQLSIFDSSASEKQLPKFELRLVGDERMPGNTTFVESVLKQTEESPEKQTERRRLFQGRPERAFQCYPAA